MNPSLRHHEPRVLMDLARDWAALGAEVRRRAAVMAAVDQFLAAGEAPEGESAVRIGLRGEVEA